MRKGRLPREGEGHRDTEIYRKERTMGKEVRNWLLLRVVGGTGFEKDMREFSGMIYTTVHSRQTEHL